MLMITNAESYTDITRCGCTVRAGWANRRHQLYVGRLTSQQHASVSHGRIGEDNFTCCHTEIKVADTTLYLTQSQYTDTGQTGPSTDPITPDTWQGSRWSANFKSLVRLDPGKIPPQAGFEPGIFRSGGGHLNH